MVHFFEPQKQEKPPLRVFRRGFAKIMAERTRFRGAALAASRGRPRGSGQPCNSPRPDGRSGRFGIRRPRASSRPPHTKTARRYKRWAVAGCGEDENRKPSTTPFVNPCRSAFYCVSLQTGSLTFEHFWAIFGPRFLTRRRHEDQEKCQFQTEGLRKE